MRRYMGREIMAIESCELRRQGYRWTLEAYHHPTGMLYAEELRPKFRSLHAAKDRIRDDAGRKGGAK